MFNTAEVARLLVFSVAQGTVGVKMCRKAFTIQMGGMWRLRSGERCVINHREVEAYVVHVSSIGREEESLGFRIVVFETQVRRNA
jgi:hypothetical protein